MLRLENVKLLQLTVFTNSKLSTSLVITSVIITKEVICIMQPAGTKKKSEYPMGIESLCPSAQRWDVLTIELLGDLSVEQGHIYLVHYDTRPAYC